MVIILKILGILLTVYVISRIWLYLFLIVEIPVKRDRLGFFKMIWWR